MRNIRPLNALLPKRRQEILGAVLLHPEKSWYISELAQRIGATPSSLQRELQSLTKAGILYSERKGRLVYYQANTESPIFPELRGLLLKTAGLVDVIANALKSLEKKLSLVFVYGSIASGTEHSDSDIDLMVIGTAQPSELALPLRRARESLERQINPTVYTAAEFDRKRKANDRFLAQVIDTPKLFVMGDRNELDRPADKKPRNRIAVQQGRAG